MIVVIVLIILAWPIFSLISHFIVYKGASAYYDHKEKKRQETYVQSYSPPPVPRLTPSNDNPFREIVPHLNSLTNEPLSQMVEYLGEPASFESFKNGTNQVFYRGTWLKSGYMLSLIFDLDKRYMYMEKTQ